jgi:aminomethyltransferase
MSTPELKKTPLYDAHVALKGRMIPFTGYSLPVQYTGIVDEHTAVRTAAGLFDVSHMGELTIEGADALAQVDRLVTNDVRGLQDGQCRYTVCCNEQGHHPRRPDHLPGLGRRVLIVCNASNREKIVGHFTREVTGATVRDISDDTALIALQGPRRWTILAEAGVDARVAELPAFHFTDATVFNVPVHLLAHGVHGRRRGGDLLPPAEALRIWRAPGLGEAHGLKPAGLGARNTLRLECKMALYGNDIDETTNPLEVGLWAGRCARQGRLHRPRRAAGGEGGARPQARGLRGHRQGHRPRPLGRAQRRGREGRLRHQRLALSHPGKNIGLAYVPVAMASSARRSPCATPSAGARRRRRREDALLQAREVSRQRAAKGSTPARRDA